MRPKTKYQSKDRLPVAYAKRHSQMSNLQLRMSNEQLLTARRLLSVAYANRRFQT
jgi:hypothetical protein